MTNENCLLIWFQVLVLAMHVWSMLKNTVGLTAVNTAYGQLRDHIHEQQRRQHSQISNYMLGSCVGCDGGEGWGSGGVSEGCRSEVFMNKKSQIRGCYNFIPTKQETV